MANATIKYGEGKWAIGENVALAYNDTNDRFKPLPFNFTRGSEATFVNRQGLIESTNTLGSEIADNNTISNDNGGVITKNSALNYSAVGDGTSVSIIRPIIKFNNFINGNRYKIVVTPTNQSGTIKFKLYDGSAYVLLENDLSSEITEYFTKGTVDAFIAFDGTETFGVNFTISVKEVTTTTNTPRIDFSNDEAGALLLEPQRTNEIDYSNDFSQWSVIGSPTLTSNYGASPDGTQNSTRVQMVSGDRIYTSITSPSEGSFSVYLKGSGVVKLRDSANIVIADVTLTSEWVRYYNIGDFSSSSNIQIQYVSGSVDLEIYGAQFEEGSYATSYIPTNGTPNTRLGEVCSDAGNSSFINSEEGVLYAEISGLADDLTKRSIALSDGSSVNRVLFRYDNFSNKIRVYVLSGGIIEGSLTFIVSDILDFLKIAVKYKENDFALWINGIEVDTDNSGTTPIGLNTLEFANGNGGEFFYGNTKGLQVFSEALSDAELQTLTTI